LPGGWVVGAVVFGLAGVSPGTVGFAPPVTGAGALTGGGVKVWSSTDFGARPRVEAMLKSFSQDDRDHMVEDGKISVTCEFCSANYEFAPADVGAKFS